MVSSWGCQPWLPLGPGWCPLLAHVLLGGNSDCRGPAVSSAPSHPLQGESSSLHMQCHLPPRDKVQGLGRGKELPPSEVTNCVPGGK